jgi:hypothetical protein
MLTYIVRRLFQMALTLFVVSIIGFLIVALAPGDPLASQLDPKKTDADAERQRDQIGYDDPVVKKYIEFYRKFFSDLGAASGLTGGEASRSSRPPPSALSLRDRVSSSIAPGTLLCLRWWRLSRASPC